LGAELLLDLSGGAFNGSAYTQIARAPGRPNDLFISRQDGNIYRVDLTTNTQSLFFSIPNSTGNDEIDTGQYWGLLGFTFAPDFATSGNLYVHVADDRENPDGLPAPYHHRIYIRRYTLTNPLSNNPTAGPKTNIMRWAQPLPDHSGGWMGFHPNDPNTLWITSGDGGNSDNNRDTLRTGQNPHDLLSGIIRINVSGSGAGEFGNYSIPADNPFADGVDGAPEVFSYGIRSPWQGSFDRQTGDFFFGDVGAFKDTTVPIHTSGDEEINFIRDGSAGGQNYGWRVMEGDFCAPASGQEPGDLPCGDPSFVAPIYVYEYGGDYANGGGDPFTGRSVTGGYVYRGPILDLQGIYIFGDWSSHQVWGIRFDRDANGGLGGIVPGSLVDLSVAFNRQTAQGTGPLEGVTSFGEDADGNLYFLELGGELYVITGPILGVAAGDYNFNGIVDEDDYTVWRDALGQSVGFYTVADGNGDGVVNMPDYDLWKENFGNQVPGAGAGSSRSGVPEPHSALLLLLGCVLMPFARRVRRCL
jgi:glucose/arabinose dehydrogenase